MNANLWAALLSMLVVAAALVLLNAPRPSALAPPPTSVQLSKRGLKIS